MTIHGRYAQRTFNHSQATAAAEAVAPKSSENSYVVDVSEWTEDPVRTWFTTYSIDRPEGLDKP